MRLVTPAAPDCRLQQSAQRVRPLLNPSAVAYRSHPITPALRVELLIKSRLDILSQKYVSQGVRFSAGWILRWRPIGTMSPRRYSAEQTVRSAGVADARW